MDRRKFLSTAALVVGAGCSANQNQNTTERERETSIVRKNVTKKPTSTRTTTTQNPTSEQTIMENEKVYRKVTLSNSGSTPDVVSLNASLVTKEIGDKHTAKVKITLENTSRSKQKYDFGYRPPFSTLHTNEKPGWLLLEKSYDVSRRSPSCWHPDLKSDAEIAAPSLLVKRELMPSESISTVVELWASHKYEDACMPVGEYRFENSYSINQDRKNIDFNWWFTINIYKP